MLNKHFLTEILTIPLSISCTASPTQGCRKPGAYLWVMGHKTPWTLCQPTIGYNHTHIHTYISEMLISLSQMFFDWGRKLVYPEETPMQTSHTDEKVESNPYPVLLIWSIYYWLWIMWSVQHTSPCDWTGTHSLEIWLERLSELV